MDSVGNGDPAAQVVGIHGGVGDSMVQHQSSQPQTDYASALQFSNPHGQFMYGNGGVVDFAGMHSPFQNPDYSFATHDVNWAQPHHHPLQTQTQDFHAQEAMRPFPQLHHPYSTPLQQQLPQPQFVSYPQSTATPISASQLGSVLPHQISAAIHSPIWNPFPDPTPSKATTQTSRSTTTMANSVPSSTPAVAAQSQIVSNDAKITAKTEPRANSIPSSPVPGRKLKGCPWVTIVDNAEVDPVLVQALAAITVSSDALPSGPAQKKLKLSTVANPTPKTLVKPPPPKLQIPTNPAERVKHLINEAFDCDGDLEDIRVAAKKLWEAIVDIQSEEEDRTVIEAALKAILKYGDDELLQHLGTVPHFAARLRKWLVPEWNRDKSSPIVELVLRTILKFRMPENMLEQLRWQKTLKSIEKKTESLKAKELCQKIMTYAQAKNASRAKEGKDRSKMQEKTKANPTTAGVSTIAPGPRTNVDKERVAGNAGVIKRAAGSNLIVGVKRKSDDEAKSALSGAVKKVALGEGRSPSSSNSNTSKVGANIPPKTIGSMLPEKKPTASSGASSSASTNTNGPVAAKPKMTSSGFFKSLAGNRAPVVKAPTKPPEKKAPNNTPPPPPTSTFTSIFDQLKQRQKNEEREKAIAKSADPASKKREAEDDDGGLNKKAKKKKTVRWKPIEELTSVKIIEFVEPEGDYYGGGSGHDHEWGNARNFDMEEGREALAALKNRNFIEEEEELVDWYQPPYINFDELSNKGNFEGHGIKRGGLKEPVSEEAKIQKQRELGTLTTLYATARDIPYTPHEPEGIDVDPPADHVPVTIPLPDHLQSRFGAKRQQPEHPIVPAADLSSLLSALTTPQQNPTQASMNGIFAHLQALTSQAQQAQMTPQIPQASIQPAADINALLAAIGSGATGQQTQQQQQQQQQANALYQNMLQQQTAPAQTQNNANNALADILAKLGFSAAASTFPPPPPISQASAAGFTPAPAMPLWPNLEMIQQALGGNVNGALQPGNMWPTNGSATDEFGRAMRDGESDKEGGGRSGRDIRRELRDASGWDERQFEKERPSGGAAGGGSGWSGKHKKIRKFTTLLVDYVDKKSNNKAGNMACIFYAKGTCKNGDSCRFSHEKSASSKSSSGGGGCGNGGGKRRGGDNNRDGAGAAGWSGTGDMQY
ncbi:hypothetical protein RUND412_003369 [Rhizina undulata]